jgi:flagellar biosynthesis protein FliR
MSVTSGHLSVSGDFVDMIFLGFGGHVIMISMIMDSFTALPIGQSFLNQASFAKVVAWSSMIFLGAVLIALPVMVSLLFINIGLGIITRAAPSLNIFSVGFPASIAAGFLILISRSKALLAACAGCGRRLFCTREISLDW